MHTQKIQVLNWQNTTNALNGGLAKLIRKTDTTKKSTVREIS